jgi:hypothetical protein
LNQTDLASTGEVSYPSIVIEYAATDLESPAPRFLRMRGRLFNLDPLALAEFHCHADIFPETMTM